jgi:hypothetical protein
MAAPDLRANPGSGRSGERGEPALPGRGSKPGGILPFPAANADGGSDSGIAGLSAYGMNQTTGTLTPISVGTFIFPSGSGSENLDVAVHPSGQFLYFTEDDGIRAFTIDQSTGALTPMSSGPLISLPFPFQIAMNSSGTVLYAAWAARARSLYFRYDAPVI